MLTTCEPQDEIKQNDWKVELTDWNLHAIWEHRIWAILEIPKEKQMIQICIW